MALKKNEKKEDINPIGVTKENFHNLFFYRSKKSPKDIFVIDNKNQDSNTFSLKPEKIKIENKIFKPKLKLENISDINGSEFKNKKIISFIYTDKKNKNIYLATHVKNKKWKVIDSLPDISEKGNIVSDYYFNKKYCMYYGQEGLKVSFSSNLKKWHTDNEIILKSRPGFFDKHDISFIACKVVEKGLLVFYDSSYRNRGEKNMHIKIGAVIFSLNNPKKVIWRSDDPVFESELPYEKDFNCKGAIVNDNSINIYWHSLKNGVSSINLNLPADSNSKLELLNELERCVNNPVISPNEVKKWMQNGAFNPTAIELEGKTHLLFRAVGEDGISRIGYSSSLDGLNFDHVHEEPVFSLKRSHFGPGHVKNKYDPVMYESGGSWGGCEDPRVTKIGDRIYMIFNAFDGWDFIRVAYTSIKEKDFIEGNWNWDRPRLISPHGQINKNWVIFPEKVNGKFAVLHSLTPEIQIDYIDRLEDLETGKVVIKSKYERKFKTKSWDTWIRGVGPSPLKTDDGWLIFYHAITADEQHKYKLGVILLDLKDPKKILARATSPILKPDLWYENDSKPGIVYACGAIIKNDLLHIYYGGGDKHVCVATSPIKDFINNLKNSKDQTPIINKIIFKNVYN